MWSLDDTGFYFQIKADCPYGIRHSFISSIDWTTNVKVFMNMNMPFIPVFELAMSSTEQWKSLENMATISISIEGNSMNMHIQYNFISALEISCEVRTSFSHFEHQRFSLGYANDQRKMLKAHLDILGHANGIEIDYKFLSIVDLVVLVRMDFPFQDWTDMHVDVASQIGEDSMNLRAGAGINKLKFGANILVSKALKH